MLFRIKCGAKWHLKSQTFCSYFYRTIVRQCNWNTELLFTMYKWLNMTNFVSFSAFLALHLATKNVIQKKVWISSFHLTAVRRCNETKIDVLDFSLLPIKARTILAQICTQYLWRQISWPKLWTIFNFYLRAKKQLSFFSYRQIWIAFNAKCKSFFPNHNLYTRIFKNN